MSNDAWSPVVPTGREKALTEEFPGYLREAVFGWYQDAIGVRSSYIRPHEFVNFQNAARTDLGFRTGDNLHWRETVLPRLRSINDADFTNLTDYLVSTSYFMDSEHPLERILSEGGSAWTVISLNDCARLAKRVPDGVRNAVQGALSATDAASLKLQEAWHDAYGTNPRASAAYSHAVVAVEIAALSVIRPKKAEATLADLFSILEAETPKWKLILRDSEKAPGAKSLATMLRTLWRGHGSRHGRPDYADASLDEARAAVILAATLVQWLTSGVVVSV